MKINWDFSAQFENEALPGKRTEFIAERTTLFDPDETWKKVDAAKP